MILFFAPHLLSDLNPIMPPTEFANFLPQSVVIYTKDVPDEVKALTRQLYDLLPRIKLPDLLLEIDSWTQYSRHFTHLQTGDPCRDRMALLTALLAEALNLGLVSMAEACDGMTFSRLTWA